jgi:hypothetical protein
MAFCLFSTKIYEFVTQLGLYLIVKERGYILNLY